MGHHWAPESLLLYVDKIWRFDSARNRTKNETWLEQMESKYLIVSFCTMLGKHDHDPNNLTDPRAVSKSLCPCMLKVEPLGVSDQRDD
jgi:hypothetical protein